MEGGSGRKRRSEPGAPAGPKPKKLDVNAPSASEPVGVTPGFNLGGRKGGLQAGNYKKVVKKVAALYQPGDLNTMPCWVFVIKSKNSEWIRFFDSSPSIIVYGKIPNPDYDASVPAAERQAEFHALQARDKRPLMYLDPTCQGTAWIKAVEVSVNNVPVKSNLFNSHLLHYTRANRIFSGRPGASYFAFDTDTVLETSSSRTDVAHMTALTRAMYEGTRPFHYRNNVAAVGNRVPIYLDGIWPFDSKCRTLETLDREREMPLYFPPDTTIEIRLHLQPPLAGIFRSPADTHAEYIARSQPTGEQLREVENFTLEFQEVVMEYESAELTEKEHLSMMASFSSPGKVAHYDYDIVKSQHCTLLANQSYTENVFQVQPFCRLVYIFFQPFFATTYTEGSHRPISGFSQFPASCSKMRVEFGGEALVAEEFLAFGNRSENHQISKKIYVDYLKERGIWRSFEEMFSSRAGRDSINQLLVFDLKRYMSAKTEHLSIQCQFGLNTSPPNQQILVISVHPTGRATCRSTPKSTLWEWEFTEKTYTLSHQ